MLGIGFEGDGTVLLGRRKHNPRQKAIQGGTDHRQTQAPADLLQGLRVKQTVAGGPDDGQRCTHDQHAFKAG